MNSATTDIHLTHSTRRDLRGSSTRRQTVPARPSGNIGYSRTRPDHAASHESAAAFRIHSQRPPNGRHPGKASAVTSILKFKAEFEALLQHSYFLRSCMDLTYDRHQQLARGDGLVVPDSDSSEESPVCIPLMVLGSHVRRHFIFNRWAVLRRRPRRSHRSRIGGGRGAVSTEWETLSAMLFP